MLPYCDPVREYESFALPYGVDSGQIPAYHFFRPSRQSTYIKLTQAASLRRCLSDGGSEQDATSL